MGSEFFGAKPQFVLTAGFPAHGVMGDPNVATGSSEPLVLGRSSERTAVRRPTCDGALSDGPRPAAVRQAGIVAGRTVWTETDGSRR